jgi:hypothetical protein
LSRRKGYDFKRHTAKAALDLRKVKASRAAAGEAAFLARLRRKHEERRLAAVRRQERET